MSGMKRKHAETLCTKPLRVLVLGDGNLSYSLGLAERLPGAQLLATSFDNPQELHKKYTESHATVTRLEALGARVRVLYGVDALNILETLRHVHMEEGKRAESFREPPHDSVSNCARTADGQPLEVFDHVIFNHPHTGWEDIHRHRALLAHFLESAKAVLACSTTQGTEGGQVHVTLAGDQCKRWKLLQTAARLGFKLRHICDFYRQFGPDPPPVDIKRHQSGKSFRIRGLPSFTYSFTLEGVSYYSATLNAAYSFPPSRSLWRHAYDPEEHEAAMTIRPGDKGVAGGSKGAPITDVVKSIKCDTCEKNFRGPKDLRKHMGDAHDKPPVQAEGQPCEACGRDFRDEAALGQHQRAKHSGMFQDLKPDWSTAALNVSETDESNAQPSLHFQGVEKEAYEASRADREEDMVLCTVCDYYVASRTAEHLADLRPPERPIYNCRSCDRTFRELRALKQHANACWPFKKGHGMERGNKEK